MNLVDSLQPEAVSDHIKTEVYRRRSSVFVLGVGDRRASRSGKDTSLAFENQLKDINQSLAFENKAFENKLSDIKIRL